MISLLSNVGATGNGPQVTVLRGGTYLWRTAGTFGGTTAKLQDLGADGSTWTDITGASATAAGTIALEIGKGSTLRAVLTGGAPTGIYSDIARLGE